MPARVPHPVCDEHVNKSQSICGHQTHFVQRDKGVKLHNGKVVAEEDECGYVNNVLRAVPKMRQELRCARCQQPDEITNDDVPESGVRHGNYKNIRETYHQGKW